MSRDISLLGLMSNKEQFEKFKPLVAKDHLLLPETAQILGDYEAFFKIDPSATSIDFDAFKVWLRTVRHSEWKMDKVAAVDAILNSVEARVKSGVDVSVVESFIRKDAADKIIEHAKKISRGDADDFEPILRSVEIAKRSSIVTDNLADMFGPTDLPTVLESVRRTHGLDWRIDSLNLAAGPIYNGDFVFLFARPEAGKTSWLCSELTYMTKFLPEDKNVVIFNPEEGRGRLFLRLLSTATNKDLITIASDEKKAVAEYEAAVGRVDRIQVVEPAGGIHLRDFHRVMEKGNYGLVAINVLDKIKTPVRYGSTDKEVDKYRNLAYVMRESANTYNVPIIAVAQASDSAEGVMWLNQSMIYGSKTGVQGEADLLIGMGHDRSIDAKRYFSVLKNKLPGGPRTLPTMKHARIEVHFDQVTGRFYEP